MVVSSQTRETPFVPGAVSEGRGKPGSLFTVYPHYAPGWRVEVIERRRSRSEPRPYRTQGEKAFLASAWDEYTGETTLHGVKYFHLETGWKKYYWALILASMVAFAMVVIIRVCSTFYNTPTLLSIDNTDHPVHRVRFPAMTVCNMNKIDRHKLPPNQHKVFGRTLFNDTDEWKNRVLHTLKNIYASEKCNDEHCEETHSAQHFSTDEIKRIIELTSPSCDEMISFCSWRGAGFPCSEAFAAHHTDFGFCCIFNADFEDDHHAEKLYTSAGYTNGLTVLLDARRYEYFHSQYLSVGFKILIHSPYDEPEVKERGIAIPPGMETFIAISAEQVFTTEEAETSFTAQQRKCYTEHEIRLAFADTDAYTLPNCLVSYATSHVYQRCGCVAHYMPGNGKVCHEKDLPCLRQELNERSKVLNHSARAWTDCLAACEETKYVPHVSSSEFPSRELIGDVAFEGVYQRIVTNLCRAVHHRQLQSWGDHVAQICSEITVSSDFGTLNSTKIAQIMAEHSAADGTRDNDTDAGTLHAAAVRYARENMIKAHVYFKSNSITRYKRDVMYTKDQLVANIGGLLGLFLGFSIVSIFEIIYFFILKFFSHRSTGRGVKPCGATQSVTK